MCYKKQQHSKLIVLPRGHIISLVMLAMSFCVASNIQSILFRVGYWVLGCAMRSLVTKFKLGSCLRYGLRVHGSRINCRFQLGNSKLLLSTAVYRLVTLTTLFRSSLCFLLSG